MCSVAFSDFTSWTNIRSQQLIAALTRAQKPWTLHALQPQNASSPLFRLTPRTAIPQGTVLQAAVIQLTRPTHTRSDFKAWNAPINVIPVAASSHTQISCILYLNMLEKKWKEYVYLLITCKAHDSSLDASLPHCVYTHKHIHRCTCTPRDYDIILYFHIFSLCYVWFELQSAN